MHSKHPLAMLAMLVALGPATVVAAGPFGPIASDFGINAHLYKGRAVPCLKYCAAEERDCWTAVHDAYMQCRKNQQEHGNFALCAQYIRTNSCDRMAKACEKVCN